MSDTERLLWVMTNTGIDGFRNVTKDRYDYATDIANGRGHDEPTKQDELDGVRMLIDTAISAN